VNTPATSPGTGPGARKIRVVIVDDVADTRENIKKLLLFEDDIEIVGAAANGALAVEAAKQLKPDVMLMDINMPVMDGITAAEAIGVQSPQTGVIMMSVQGEADYLRRSMLAGAREFLIKPFTGDELVEGIRHVYELGAQRREAAPAAAALAAQQAIIAAQPAAAAPTQGKVFAVFSPKGGIGRSTIAANLAVALKMDTGKKVVLVDASLQFGDLGVMLNLEPKKSIADLAASAGDLDGELLNGVLVNHMSGIRVLLAPPRPELADLVTTDVLKKVLHRLQQDNDYVVVDTWTYFHDQSLAVLDIADRIVLLANSELTTIKNVRLFLEVSEALGYPAEKIMLVLNHVEGRAGISAQDIQRSVNHSVAASVVSDPQAVLSAVNRGVPFGLGYKDSQIARNVHDLADLLVGGRSAVRPVGASTKGDANRPMKKRSMIDRLFGR
jgi:pilus assembly protein CpaE